MPKFGPSIKSLLTNKDKLYELARTPLNEHCSAVLLKKLPEKLGDPSKFLIPYDFPGKAEWVAEDVYVKVGELTLRVGKEAINFNLDQTSRYSANYNDMTAKRIYVINMACEEYSQEFLVIIESKSKVPYSRNKPVVAKVSTNTFTSGISPDVAELKDMVKALLLDKKSQNQALATVKAVEESYVTCGGAHSYHNYPATDGNVYHDNIQELVSQASAANDAVMRNMQTQGQNMQNQLTNLTDFLTKFVNTNNASTSSSGTLPSNTIANSRSDLKAITTQSGVSYDGPQILPPPSFLPKVVENEPEKTKDTMHPTNNRSTEDVQPLVVQYKSLILTFKQVNSPISEPVISPVSAPRP
nr:reverse transcriptase domain-containing protein [Tanacetum cinerariifolium]